VIELLLVYVRLILYPLAALAYLMLATMDRSGSARLHGEKLVQALYFLLVFVAVFGRALGHLEWQSFIADYFVTPSLAALCLALWRVFYQLGRRPRGLA
jgi:hypothetical protein